jgi:GNAT superfamily N-acetyltransferase
MQGADERAGNEEAERALPARGEDLERLAELVGEAVNALGAARGGERLLASGALDRLLGSPGVRDGAGAPAVVVARRLGALVASPDALLLGGWYAGALVGVALAERVRAGSREPGSSSRAGGSGPSGEWRPSGESGQSGEWRQSGQSGRIGLLYVEPPARGVGVGEALLVAALRWCADNGCADADVAALPGDRATKALLERHGFRARVIVMSRLLG